MIENQQLHDNDYAVIELLEDLRKGVFAELYNGKKVDAYRRNLQRSYVAIAIDYINKLEDDDDVATTDIIALMRGELETLQSQLNRMQYSTSDRLSRYHYKDLIARIEKAFAEK